MIAGDSIYVADVAESPQERATELSRLNGVFIMNGAFEYCDALGTYSCRQFILYYQGVPFDRFRMVSENECPVFLRTPPIPGPDIEYLPFAKHLKRQILNVKMKTIDFENFRRKKLRRKSLTTHVNRFGLSRAVGHRLSQ